MSYRLVEIRVARLAPHHYVATAILEDQSGGAYRGFDLTDGPYYGRTHGRAWRKAWRDNGAELVPRLSLEAA